MTLESDGSLVFLLFIPLLWVLWLWVYRVFLPSVIDSELTVPADDRLETCYHMSCLSSFLQLLGYVLFR
jgi:hypothetical protein